MIRSEFCLLVLALAVLSTTGAAPVLAQGSSFVLEEVIVTARKRTENLQQTPVAVTALSATALREAGVRSLSDLNQIAPNIEVQAGNGNAGGVANIYIRGVGQRNTGPNLDSGVGIYIDDVFVGRPDGGLLDVNDIASIQVLRGPQGTLFGKNTTGGALVFTTNRPVDEFEGSLEVRAGNFDRQDVSGVFNIPIADNLWSRFSFNSISRDGYIENLYDGKDYVDEDRVSAIGQLRWMPSEDLTIDLNVNFSDTDQTARPQKCVPLPGVIGWQAALFDGISVIPSSGRTYDDYCQDSADLKDPRDVLSDLGGKYEAETKGASIKAEWDFANDLTFTSVTAWRYSKALQDDELDHTAIPWLHRTQGLHPDSSPRETDQYSQEIQLSGSAFDERMNFVTGAYYFTEEITNNRAVNYLGPFDPGIAGFFMLNTTSTLLEAKHSSYAIFSQVEWAYTDNWRSTFGIRYTDEDRELYRKRWNVDPDTLGVNGGVLANPFNGGWVVDRNVFEYNPNFSWVDRDIQEQKTDDSDTTIMGSIQYLINESDWIDDGSIYLTYSEGFRSGGLSEAPTDEFDVFQPEQVENWELGVKLDLLDRRLRINAAAFYSDYTDRQLTTLVVNLQTNSPAGATINAEESTITGFEIETTWLAAENLELTANATWSSGDIDKYADVQVLAVDPTTPVPVGCDRADLTFVVIDQCPSDRSSENLPRLPEATFFLAAQYSWKSDLGIFIPRIQMSLKQDIEYCFDATSCELGLWNEDEQFDLSARVTWISNDEKWMGSVYGVNLTDEDHMIGGSALTESAGVGGFVPAPPRMYGVELKYSF